MVSDRGAYGAIVAGIAVGLVLLVYGMQLSAGQSMNAPALAGGAVILAAIAVMTVRIARLDGPAHGE